MQRLVWSGGFPYDSVVTVLEVIQRSTHYLTRKGVDSPRLQIELILAHLLKMPRLNLYLEFQRELGEPELNAVRDMVRRRGNRVPLQHILGTTSFCGLEMKVTPAVLVPRPETELLAECAWKHLNAMPRQVGERLVLDYGTGSGCLGIAIAVHVPSSRVWAVDISDEALAIAQENAERHAVRARMEFIAGDSFAALPSGLRFDLMVSNPPYIPTDEITTLAPEVRDHDPRHALDGGSDGLAFYRLFASEAGRWLQPDGRLMAEFGDGQEESVRAIFNDRGWVMESVEPDLSGRPRFFIARCSGMRKE